MFGEISERRNEKNREIIKTISKIIAELLYSSQLLIIENIRKDALILFTEVISKELFYVHHGGIILAREPTAARRC